MPTQSAKQRQQSQIGDVERKNGDDPNSLREFLCRKPVLTNGSPPMVGERSPKPSMWVRFLPSVLLRKIASNLTSAYTLESDCWRE